MTIREQLNAIASRRVLILDGAMGSMIQALGLTEEDFRGSNCACTKERFAGYPPLKGCNDLLCLTKPEAISAIHDAYLEAGADIIATCSFNSTKISLSEYGLGDFAYEISAAAASAARKCADKFSTPDKPRFAAGSIGPTAKSASIPPDFNDLSKRAVYWNELEAAFYDNARGLLDGGADIFLIETFFDTLNIKAALFAISRLLKERNADAPVMVSATVSGDSPRLLSGQTLEAFCISVLHAKPWAVGLNCSFGAEKLLPHVRLLAGIAPCLVSAHPNAGLPNQSGAYDETPETMSANIEAYLKEGLVNIVGGCCGSAPAHIAAIAEKAAGYKPRPLPHIAPFIRLAGLEPLVKENPADLVVAWEKKKFCENQEFMQFLNEGKYEDAVDAARDIADEGAEIIDINTDSAKPDPEKAMHEFLGLALADPYIAKIPVMLCSLRWNVLEAGLKCLQGKGLVNSIDLQDGEKEFLRKAELIRRYGAAVMIALADEKGQAQTQQRKNEITERVSKLLADIGFPAENIVFCG